MLKITQQATLSRLVNSGPELDTKYFRFCGPHCLSHAYLVLPLLRKSSHRQEISGHGCVALRPYFQKNSSWVKFSLLAVVRWFSLSVLAEYLKTPQCKFWVKLNLWAKPETHLPNIDIKTCCKSKAEYVWTQKHLVGSLPSQLAIPQWLVWDPQCQVHNTGQNQKASEKELPQQKVNLNLSFLILYTEQSFLLGLNE